MESADEQRDAFGRERASRRRWVPRQTERPHVVETLSTLGPHLLGTMGCRGTLMWKYSLQDRGGKEQRVTLRTSLPGRRTAGSGR